MNRALLTLMCLTACGVETPTPNPTAPAQQLQPEQPQKPEQQEDVPDAATPPTGFPCDVQAVLEQNCARCHAGTTYVRAFTTRAAFLELDSTGQTLGQAAVKKLTDPISPMPPYGQEQRPTAEQIATVASWVNAGMPAGDCGALTPQQ